MTNNQKTIAVAGSTQEGMTVRYAAKTRTSDGAAVSPAVMRVALDVRFSAPGVPGTGTKPEQLFAAG